MTCGKAAPFKPNTEIGEAFMLPPLPPPPPSPQADAADVFETGSIFAIADDPSAVVNRVVTLIFIFRNAKSTE